LSLGFNLGIASALACLAMIEGECLAMIEGECLAMTKIFRNVVRGFSLVRTTLKGRTTEILGSPPHVIAVS